MPNLPHPEMHARQKGRHRDDRSLDNNHRTSATITLADETEAGNAEEQPARDNQQGATDNRSCGSLRIPTALSKTHPSLPKCLKKPPCRRQGTLLTIKWICPIHAEPVHDLHRRCEISDKCNERYGDALAAVQVEEKLKEVAFAACNKVKKKGKRYRGLNPWQEEDYKLLTFLAKGEHAIVGFRNKDLRSWLYPESKRPTKDEQKRYSGRTTRRIKLLRVHGLIKKVAKENRYILTAKGQKFAGALMSASAVDIKGLTNIAA